MSKDEIFILCNSPECLQLISSGAFPDLQEQNLFTCNNAFTFFRTTATHLNIMVDAVDILRFLAMPEKLFKDYEQNLGFVISTHDMACNKSILMDVYPPNKLMVSPIKVGASSAIHALFFLNSCNLFKTIWLVGYTIDEWDGMDKFPNLTAKKMEFEKVYANYKQEMVRPYVYKYTRKNG